MRFAQIVDNVVHWLFEANEKPEFHESIIIVDVTGVEDIQEGYVYDSEINKFSPPNDESIEPEQPEPTQEELQLQTLLNTEFLVIMSEISGL